MGSPTIRTEEGQELDDALDTMIRRAKLVRQQLALGMDVEVQHRIVNLVLAMDQVSSLLDSDCKAGTLGPRTWGPRTPDPECRDFDFQATERDVHDGGWELLEGEDEMMYYPPSNMTLNQQAEMCEKVITAVDPVVERLHRTRERVWNLAGEAHQILAGVQAAGEERLDLRDLNEARRILDEILAETS